MDYHFTRGTYAIITNAESLAALEQAARVTSRLCNGIIIAVPDDGFRFQVINMVTGEKLPEASAGYRDILGQTLDHWRGDDD